MENQHHNQLMALQDLKDKESSEKIKKLNERLKSLETEKSNLEEEFDSYKSRACVEKRHLMDKMSDAETRIRHEEETKRRELDSKVSQLIQSRDQMASDLALRISQHSQSLKEHEIVMDRISDLTNQIAQFKAKEAHHCSYQAEAESKIKDLRKELQDMNSEVQRLLSLNKSIEMEHNSIKIEKRELQQQLAAKDSLISRLRESMDHADDDYMLQVIVFFSNHR